MKKLIKSVIRLTEAIENNGKALRNIDKELDRIDDELSSQTRELMRITNKIESRLEDEHTDKLKIRRIK